MLEGDELTYFTNQTKESIKGKHILSEATKVESIPDIGYHKNTFMLTTDSRSLLISAENVETKLAWTDAIRVSIKNIVEKLDEQRAQTAKDSKYVDTIKNYFIILYSYY